MTPKSLRPAWKSRSNLSASSLRTPRLRNVLRRGAVGEAVIRELPRGPFDSYLRANYYSHQLKSLPQFSMGCGAIFMIHRVRALDADLPSGNIVAETDPLLLEEMLALIAARGLDVVSLAEMRRRIVERDLERRFVCFTFDGAYRSILDKVVPLFEKRKMPFAVYAATDYLDSGLAPWWLTLEIMIERGERIWLDPDGGDAGLRCRSREEKQAIFARLYKRLSRLDRDVRRTLLDSAMKKQGLEKAELAEKAMLSGDELRKIDRNERATIGVLASGANEISELGFDRARRSLEQAVHKLEAVIGKRPRHLAFRTEFPRGASMRDTEIARRIGFETAVTAMEGALWPEHRSELLSLPRIALDRDPAALVRVLMLSRGEPYPRHRRAYAEAV